MTHAKIPEPVKTGKPFYLKTEIPKNRRAVKPNDAEGWVKTEHDMRIQEVVDAALETYLGLE